MTDFYKYAELFKSQTAYASLGKESGAYAVYTEDIGAARLFARLIISRCYGIDEKVAFSDKADIIELPVEGENLSVKDIDFICENCYLTPFELPKRFYIIDKAHTMSEMLQNKLLKTLETPPEPSCFILLAEGEGLIRTVKSRCRTVNLLPFPDEVVHDAVLKARPELYDDAGFKLAVASSRGLIGECEKRISDISYTKIFTACRDVILGTASSRDVPRSFSKLSKYKRDELTTALDFMELIFADGARYCAGLTRALALSEDDLSALNAMYDRRAYPKVFALIRAARERLKNNGNLNSIIDELLYSLTEEKAKWKKLQA